MNEKLRTAARELAFYSYNMGESLADADYYALWRAEYMAARQMLFTLTGLEGTTIGNVNNVVTIMLTDESDESNCYTFEFQF